MTTTSAPAFTVTFEDADPDALDLLGGKGAGLARMTQSGLRVPPGYVISTEACRSFLTHGVIPPGLSDEVFEQLSGLEERSGKTFGRGSAPLLLSVRSGAPVSMPGMMDTVLNLGLCRDTAITIARTSGSTRFMADLVARFHCMFSEIVLDSDPGHGIDEFSHDVGENDDPAAVYDSVWRVCQQALLDESDQQVPDDPRGQLMAAVSAVFSSWNTRRAKTYREFHHIPQDLGTAVVVQSMVFGNLSDDSGSGVVFTRNPVTGEPGLFGEYLAHSQGEDVVAGTRTPDPVTTALPSAVLEELRSTCADLERAHGDVLDIEFTIERSVLYFLQVRSAKRTPEAAVRIASDFLTEGAVDPGTVLRNVTPTQVRQVQRPGFDATDVQTARDGGRLVTTGIGACPGQVCGKLVLDADRAKAAAEAGEAVILARPVTSPGDLPRMIAARGNVTATGGSTSHAAVVARALGTTCVVGAGELVVDLDARTATAHNQTLNEGDEVSLDGGTGELFAGVFTTATPASASASLASLLKAATTVAASEVLARVTLPADVESALAAGATGLVTAVDDVLAATGHLSDLVETLRTRAPSSAEVTGLADMVAAVFVPLLAAAGAVEADESREVLQQTAITTSHPALAVPLGTPALVQAQLEGLARAVLEVGNGVRVHLAVRHISDPAEARALRTLQRGGDVEVGTYLTSTRGVFNAGSIAGESDVLWLELRTLQATVFGLPTRQLLTAEPLDDYLSRGLLSHDPREVVDPAVDPLLVHVAEVANDVPSCRVGVRLSGEITSEVVERLHGLGIRRFAVDSPETGPMTVALGLAAFASQLRVPAPTKARSAQHES